MLNITCSMISSVDLVHYEVSRAKDCVLISTIGDFNVELLVFKNGTHFLLPHTVITRSEVIDIF